MTRSVRLASAAPAVSAVLAALVCLSPSLSADDPKPKAVSKGIAFNLAMSSARDLLTQNSPREAVDLLEAQLPNADGSRAFLGLLRDAYVAELKQLETAASPDATRLAYVKSHLNQLGRPDPAPSTAPTLTPAAAPAEPALGPAVTTPAPVEPPAVGPAEADPLQDARALFKQERFADAAAKFAVAKARGTQFKADELTAWAYCRVKVAADRVNAAGCDAATAAAAAQDVTDALQLVPNHPELIQKGNAVLVAARQKSGGRSAAASAPAASADGWEVIETASFRVRHKGARELADAIAKTAEAKRKETFEKWSGPASGPWDAKCVIVLHPTAADYAKSTAKPAEGTGHALVKLTDGRAAERRIDLRADDPAAAANALPRELTHVVLADLFPDRPPPKWAEEGMAVLAGSPEEVGRFVRTLPRCAQRGEWIALVQLLEMKDPPADKLAGFYCESVSVVDYLVKVGGARNFTIFLREIQRYGIVAALKRNYQLDGPQALEAAWKRAALEGLK
ncbi:MAG TPA: hypothetical protein VMZ71_02745 [Gemmataceae bacterium]|nr:hypothetical protein [Gemmataceae bacterium]